MIGRGQSPTGIVAPSTRAGPQRPANIHKPQGQVPAGVFLAASGFAESPLRSILVILGSQFEPSLRRLCYPFPGRLFLGACLSSGKIKGTTHDGRSFL